MEALCREKYGMRDSMRIESIGQSWFASRIPPDFNPLRFCSPPRQTTQGRQALIAKAAYFRAEKRGFQSGHELEDWFTAEAEVDQQLRTRADATTALW
jgi:hypothetical protein